MNKLNIGLIGYGTVGSGVVKLLLQRKALVKAKYNVDLNLKTLCDRSIAAKNPKAGEKTVLTSNIADVLNDPEINVVVELIGGMAPAKDIAFAAVRSGKHFVTANKELIANCGLELFAEARRNNCQVYFEASVGAGIPIIKTITEGMAGNQFNRIYGIINGTCNYILTSMTQLDCSFGQALDEAQKKGFAESNPTLDINGMDSTHKLVILVMLAFGQHLNVKDIYTEGISQISHDDIEYAESMGLAIKLLAIAKKSNEQLEVRVHPTLISQQHPLASVGGIHNAVFMEGDALGDLLLYGQGAGQMTTASGVFADLVNLGSSTQSAHMELLANLAQGAPKLPVRSIDEVETRFYIRFMAIDKPGILAKIAGILAAHDISIASLTQKTRNKSYAVPLIMQTHETTERNMRNALTEIAELSVVKSKPVVIRVEQLS